VLCTAREASDMGWEFILKHGDFGPFVKRCRHKFICNACGRGFTQRLATCRSTEPGVGDSVRTLRVKEKAEREREGKHNIGRKEESRTE
jgi:hypothetical protein